MSGLFGAVIDEVEEGDAFCSVGATMSAYERVLRGCARRRGRGVHRCVLCLFSSPHLGSWIRRWLQCLPVGLPVMNLEYRAASARAVAHLRYRGGPSCESNVDFGAASKNEQEQTIGRSN